MLMVPQNAPPPPDQPRELNPAALAALGEVISERWRALESSEDRLRAALRVVAVEARDRGFLPEELIIILKELEAGVFARPGTIRARDAEARARFHSWLVSTCLEAFFDGC